MTTKTSAAHWIRPAYLYIVSLVAIIVFIIGTSMMGNLLIRRYVFGLQYSWYQSPEDNCEYIRTQERLPAEYLGTKGERPVTAPVDSNDTGIIPTTEERQARYDRCIETSQKQMDGQAKYEFANTMSNGIAMDLLAIPIFLFHWALIRREQRKNA